MYALLDDNDLLVAGEPVAIYQYPQAITLPNGDQLPRNWMQMLSQPEKEAFHIWPLTTTTFNSDQFHESGPATFDFTAGLVIKTLTTTANTEPLSLNRYKDKAFAQVDGHAEYLKTVAEETPSLSQDYSDDDRGKLRADKRRNNRAKSNTVMTDADDHLSDHIDLILDAADLIRDDIENAVDYDTVDAYIALMPTDVRWPIWTPIA